MGTRGVDAVDVVLLGIMGFSAFMAMRSMARPQVAANQGMQTIPIMWPGVTQGSSGNGWTGAINAAAKLASVMRFGGQASGSLADAVDIGQVPASYDGLMYAADYGGDMSAAADAFSGVDAFSGLTAI